MRLNRTAVAAILVATAVALPCVSWFVAERREVAREVERLEHEPQLQARQSALSLAEQLAARLEALRSAESKRPFYHYQSLYNDPKGAAEGIAVAPSPLVSGPADALIHTYFQVDAKGQLTLPTLNEEAPEITALANVVENRRILEELRPLSAVYVAATREKLTPRDPVNRQMQRVERIDRGSYEQNQMAGQLYVDIRRDYGQRGGQQSQRGQGGRQQGDVEIGLSEFRWFTLPGPVEGSLMALREVETPDGRLTQGFILALDRVTEWLNSQRAALYPAHLSPGSAEGFSEATVALTGVPWRIVLDAQMPVAAAGERARSVKETFYTRFFAGAAAAALAALGIVFLVWQTDRLARQRAQFAAAAAHELRTPLAGMQMYGEMLADGLGDPRRSSEYARRIATEAARLGRVVANVLEFTRLERGRLNLHVERDDLAAVVCEAVERQRPSLESAGLRVEVKIEENLLPIALDRDAVSRMVQNLLDNAEKYTRETAQRAVRVSVASGQFSVTDSGPGLPSEMKRRLFRPFARGRRLDAPAGLGLGLALVHALARAQNADVRYADAPGGGAEFTVKFPTR